MVTPQSELDNELTVKEYLSKIFENLDVFSIEKTNQCKENKFDIQVVMHGAENCKNKLDQDFLNKLNNEDYIKEYSIGSDSEREDLGPVCFITINKIKLI